MALRFQLAFHVLAFAVILIYRIGLRERVGIYAHQSILLSVNADLRKIILMIGEYVGNTGVTPDRLGRSLGFRRH